MLPPVELGDSAAATAHKPGTGFAANVLKLVSGSASAQVLSILAAPLVARLLAPEAFGAAALFVSITGVISAVVGMRYELSIVLPKEDEEAANTAAVSLFFICLTTLATAGFVAVATAPMLRLFHAPELAPYMWLAPVNVFLNGIYAPLSYWATRKGRFGRLTISQVASTSFFVVAQIAAGLSGHSSGGAIIVLTVASVFVGTFALGAQTVIEPARLFARKVRYASMLAALKRYSNFPKYSTASAVLSNLGWQMPTFILSAFFSANVVGQYTLGNRVLRIPVNLLGANIATVFFQHASEANHKGTLTASVETMFQYLARIWIFPSLMLGLIGKELFAVAFGGRWAEAGIYTQILSAYVLFWFMSVPLGIALNVMEKQALELRLIVIVLLVRVVALLAGGEMGSARLALAFFSIAGVVVYGHYCWTVLRQCGVAASRIGGTMLSNVTAFLPAGALVAAAKYFHLAPIMVLALASLLVFVYYALLVRSDVFLQSIARGLLAQVWRTAAAPPSSKGLADPAAN
jgi:O-antigen/teichoic acid export membrane protein